MIVAPGGVPEWLNGAVSKTVDGGNVVREFESLPLRFIYDSATSPEAAELRPDQQRLLAQRRPQLVVDDQTLVRVVDAKRAGKVAAVEAPAHLGTPEADLRAVGTGVM